MNVEEVVFAPLPQSKVPFAAIAADTAARFVPGLLALGAAFVALRYGGGPLARGWLSAMRSLEVRRASRAVAGYGPSHVRGVLRDEPRKGRAQHGKAFHAPPSAIV